MTTELYLPADPPQGCWADVEEGARSEEHQREVGIDLSRREECGPVRCALRVIRGATARREPELEVELTNTSEEPVLVQIHRFPLDQVTFVLRDPDDAVVSSFCYRTVSSQAGPSPPIALGPGESDTSRVYLSVAADHGFQPLRSGLYSLEAVFVQPTMLARSNRLTVIVSDGNSIRERAARRLAAHSNLPGDRAR
jgi:hypothetical protein